MSARATLCASMSNSPLCVATICNTVTISPADYYVDYTANGSDFAAGTNPLSPAWQHCPGDGGPSVGPAPEGTPLLPGDTVYFKGGVQYVFTESSQGGYTPGIQLSWSGSSAEPITYTSTNTWGNGMRAIFTDNYATNNYAAFWDYYGASNIVFNNLEIGPMGGSNSLPSNTGSNTNGVPPNPAWGIFVAGIALNVTIENCYFHNIGYWYNQAPMTSESIRGGGASAAGINISPGPSSSPSGVNGLTVTNCEFTHVCNGIEVEYTVPSYNLTVVNCKFHDYIVWCINPQGLASGGNSGITLNNVWVYGNQFYDWDWAYAPDYWTGYGDPPHQDGIYAEPQSCGSGTNCNYYNNVFWGTHTNSQSNAAVGIWLASGSGNAYNNVIDNTGRDTFPIQTSAGIESPSELPSTMRVYNNTVIANTTNASYQVCQRITTDMGGDTSA